MGINIFPTPTQNVTIDGGGNTVKVANAVGVIGAGNELHVRFTNTPSVKLDSTGNLFKSLKGNSTNITGQSIITVGSSTALTIHSVTISQNCISQNPSDGSRLGVSVFYNANGTLNNNNIIASNFNFDGTTFHNFPNGGIRLPAGDDLWVCADQYDATGISYNFVVSVAYSEVTTS